MKKTVLLNLILLISLICVVTASNAQMRTFEKTFGGSNADYGHSLATTSDGGFILTGLTLSFGDTLGDTYLIKTDSEGTQQWFKIISGPELEGGNSVVQTSDGGFLLINHTESFGAGDCDSWTIKTDALGNIQWSQTFGGTGDDVGEDGIQTSDGNYAVTGIVRTVYWGGNAFIIKYNSNGDILWTKIYDQFPDEIGMRIVEDNDGGFVVACAATTSNIGTEDILVFKVNSSGEMIWSKKIGGTGNEEAYGLLKTTDGNFIVAGFSTSFGSGDEDAYIVKLNSSGSQIWSRNYGGLSNDRAESVTATQDGGLMVTGYTGSFGDSSAVLLFKTDANGNLIWLKTFGNDNYIKAGAWIVSCSDGGYAIAGSKQRIGTNDADLYLLKTDHNGNISTGIVEPEASLSGLIIYPDPAVSYINLSFDNHLVNPEIEIFDSEGKIVLRVKNQTKINVEDLPAGLYCLKLKDGSEILTQRFVRM